MGFVRTFVLVLILTEMVALVYGCRNDSKPHDGLSKDSVSNTIPILLTERTYMRLVDSADYQDDFEEAIARADMRFVGVLGYALQVPGVPDYDTVYSKSNGVKIIEGTSDSHPDSASLAQSVFFKSYAMGYNTLLLNHLTIDTE